MAAVGVWTGRRRQKYAADGQPAAKTCRTLLVQSQVRHVSRLPGATGTYSIQCPWSKHRKTRRLNLLKSLPGTLSRRERLYYEDEVDIHLNPKIGLDWMGYGQQKEAMTPGKNQKRYLAGALDVRSGEITWVEADHKTSYLFLDLLDKLCQRYPEVQRFHLGALDSGQALTSDCFGG